MSKNDAGLHLKETINVCKLLNKSSAADIIYLRKISKHNFFMCDERVFQ
ncbi:hypothetical protein [Citrobacter freundii]|uniref:Uncharacterized protein n=1 Tax=Citrobacter freundii TaxID=546 RepID=A0A7G2IT90_CITFR|nr:hypothetical protein [Citrobacter freundii]